MTENPTKLENVFPDVYFDDINFTELFDVYLMERPLIAIAEMKYETIDVPDGESQLTRELGYSSKPFALNFKFIDGVNVKSKTRTIINWLTGKKRIKFSDDMTVYRIIQTMNFSDANNQIKQVADLQVIMQTQPFWYQDEPTQLITTLNATILNPSIIPAKTIITIIGNGTCNITLNGEMFTIRDVQSTVTIDGILEEAYKGTLNKNNDMTGKYPVLKAGTNSIYRSGSISRIEVLRRWCWR